MNTSEHYEETLGKHAVALAKRRPCLLEFFEPNERPRRWWLFRFRWFRPPWWMED